MGKEIGWPQALPAVLGSGEGGKRRKASQDAILGCLRTGGEPSQSGGRGSRRELLAWGTFPGRAPPPRRRPRASTTSGRGAEREGGSALRGAARPLGAPRRTAQVRVRVGGRGPLPYELCGEWGGSPILRCHGHEPSIFGLSFLLRVPWPATQLGFKRSAGSNPQQQAVRSASSVPYGQARTRVRVLSPRQRERERGC